MPFFIGDSFVATTTQPTPKGQSIGLKVVLIGFLVIVLLIPSLLILGLIMERESQRDHAVREVSSMWGGEQNAGAVMLTVPYEIVRIKKDGTKDTDRRHAHFLPNLVKIETQMTPVSRYRGIYQVILYKADIAIDVAFSFPDFARWDEVDPGSIKWEQAYLTIGVGDTKGVESHISVVDGAGKALDVQPGSKCRGSIPVGATVMYPLDPSNPHFQGSFAIRMTVRGSGNMQFMPFGKSTEVSVHSPWKNPSYTGSFLPSERTLGANGFHAVWKVSEFNRNYPQQWLGTSADLRSPWFGVTLYQPVDAYTKTERAVKYAILFIGLTFLGFFLVEILGKISLHPMNYLLVGFAVTLFYLLLLSLSEHIAFGYAYLAGGGSVVLLTWFYLVGATKRAAIATSLAGTLGGLYSFL